MQGKKKKKKKTAAGTFSGHRRRSRRTCHQRCGWPSLSEDERRWAQSRSTALWFMRDYTALDELLLRVVTQLLRVVTACTGGQWGPGAEVIGGTLRLDWRKHNKIR
jgi:hypothetical protein